MTQVQARGVSGDDIVRQALNHHERYVYGKSDCSALTQKVFRKFGIRLPRTSQAQARVGKPVSRKHLKKGDLVFFATGKKGVISHVGIYAGKGKMINAESHYGVKKTGCFTGPSSHYWKSKYIKARRVI
ncbi:NlpC/P60 family protein [Sporolactobacillus sp. THM7-4]|nr:NlpC/P60 family protein [Sporolactobacillus sp. THM7-4]